MEKRQAFELQTEITKHEKKIGKWLIKNSCLKIFSLAGNLKGVE